MRKLIFLWTYTTWGGAQIYFFAIMKLAHKEWDIIVVLPRQSRPDLLQFLDALGIRYEYLEYKFDPKLESTISGKLRRQFERIRSEVDTFRHLLRYDLSESVLHIEIAPWQSWILLAMLALRRANTFATLHNFRPEIAWWRSIIWKMRFQVLSRLPRFSIFASNIDTKNNLKGWVTPEFWAKIKVTYTCVDPKQIDRVLGNPIDKGAMRRRFGIPEDKFVVLAVGQFVDRKGRWTFLQAARQIRLERNDIVFVWVMPQEIDDAADKTRIEQYDLNGAFFPIVSSALGSDRISILSFFRIADVFALPSFIEGLPIALLEAMALGIPTISTNVYAIPEAVRDENTGLLVEAGDVAALNNAIIRLKEDADLRLRLATEGSRFVLENFDEREAAADCISSYRACFH